MNNDTMDMWQHAIARQYWDWHPIAIPVLWSKMRIVYAGPQSMLVFEDLLFCVGAILVFQARCGRWTTVALVTLVAIFPPIFAYLGIIGKDSLLATSMIFTIGLYYRYVKTRQPWMFGLGVLAGFLAFSARQNAVFAVAPVLGLLFWESLRHRKRQGVLSTILVVSAVVVFSGANSLIKSAVHARISFPFQVIPLCDLAALSAETRTLLIPGMFVAPGSSLDTIAEATNSRSSNALWFQRDSPLRLSFKAVDIEELLRAWATSVLHHPILYLRWRYQVFLALAGFGEDVASPYDAGGVVPNPLGLSLHRTPLAVAELWFLHRVGNSLFFRAYIYVGLLALLVALGIRRRRVDLVVIAGSGLSYFFVLVFLVVNSEFRFSVYTVFIAVVLLGRLLAERTPPVRRGSHEHA